MLTRKQLLTHLVAAALIATFAGCTEYQEDIKIHSYKKTVDGNDLWVYWYLTQNGQYQYYSSPTRVALSSSSAFRSVAWTTSSKNPQSEEKEEIEEQEDQEVEVETETTTESATETGSESAAESGSSADASPSSDSGSSGGGDSGGGGGE